MPTLNLTFEENVAEAIRQKAGASGKTAEQWCAELLTEQAHATESQVIPGDKHVTQLDSSLKPSPPA